MQLEEIKVLAEKIKENVSKVIVDKEEIIDLSLICIITGGHLLLGGCARHRENGIFPIVCRFHRLRFFQDTVYSRPAPLGCDGNQLL
jgi:hypothetical protein